MFRKIFFTFALGVTAALLVGCSFRSNSSNEEGQTAGAGPAAEFERRLGVVRELGNSIYQQGTHRLEHAGQTIALLESKAEVLRLDDYLNQTVEVEGVVRKTVEGQMEILQVFTLTPKAPENLKTENLRTEYASFQDPQFGFKVRYPTVFQLVETRRGLSLNSGGQKIIEVVVLENELEQVLANFLQDRYGYTPEQIVAVQVAGVPAYRFQNSNGEVVYLARSSQVFALTWYDSDLGQRAKFRRYFLEFVQNFQLITEFDFEAAKQKVPRNFAAKVEEEGEESEQFAALGEVCGVEKKIFCKAGLKCDFQGSAIAGEGVCVPATAAATADQFKVNSGLQKITEAELARGWYYGDQEAKKPGTPETWFLVNAGTRAAIWRRPAAAAEVTPELAKPNRALEELNKLQKRVFGLIKDQLQQLAPEAEPNAEWAVKQLAFAEPNFVYVIYATPEKTRKLLLTYEEQGSAINWEKLAYFKPGEGQDWVLREGKDLAFGKALTVVEETGAVTEKILEGYSLFLNRHHNYALQYPDDWFWQNANKDRTEFAESSFPAAQVRISAEIVAGSDFIFEELTVLNESNVIYLRLTEEQSLELKGAPRDAAIMEVMAQTFERR